MQEPMAMGTLMTSQQSYSILRGTQLRILSRVLLEIACTCIMHRECAREDSLVLVCST
jgi:hypothetical protein